MLMMARRDQHEGNSLLVGAPAVAALLGKSTRTINRLAEDGHLPPSVKLPGPRMWRRKDIEAWVDAGCSLRAFRRAKQAKRG